MLKEVEIELLKPNLCVISCLGTPWRLIGLVSRCQEVQPWEGPIFERLGISIDHQLVCKLDSHWWLIGHLPADLGVLPFEFWR